MTLIITCEHASAAVPEKFQYLFEGPHQQVLDSHRGWDPGALELAQLFAERLAAPLLKADCTRLLLDLNRSPENPGRWSEYSESLTNDEREDLNTTLFNPYWEQLSGEVEALVQKSRQVLHLSIHSFVRVLNGIEREVDIGVLYDPERTFESIISHGLISTLRSLPGNTFRVLENQPYAGTDDGLTRILRTRFSDSDYAGIELEICSDLLDETDAVHKMADQLCPAIKHSLKEGKLSSIVRAPLDK